MDQNEEFDRSLSKTQPGLDLLEATEEFYFWLMRACSTPQSIASTFQELSQIMRIIQVSCEGANYLSFSTEYEALKILQNVKEQVKDGKIQITQLFDPIQKVLEKLTHQNPKALLVARATEIEYLFCINSSFVAPDIHFKETFKNYLKKVVNTIHNSLSETQIKSVVQTMSFILENSKELPQDPQKTLQEGISRAGITIIPHLDNPTTFAAPDSVAS